MTWAKVYAAVLTGVFGRNVEDYCELCRGDILRAKAKWRRGTPSRLLLEGHSRTD